MGTFDGYVSLLMVNQCLSQQDSLKNILEDSHLSSPKQVMKSKGIPRVGLMVETSHPQNYRENPFLRTYLDP